MAANIGRTPSKFIRIVLHDASGVLREVPVAKLGNAGLTYPEVDLTAIQDALKGFLQGIPNFSMTLSGPWDTSVAVAASASGAKPALSGSHTVLQPLNGRQIPISFGVLYGVRHYWEAGEPTFSITSTATSGMIISEYIVVQNGEGVEYSCKLSMYPGSDAPIWGTAIPA